MILNTMAQFRTSRIFDVTLVLTLMAILFIGYLNKIAVNDGLFFLHYRPSSLATQVAKDAGLSPYGQRLFYRTNPTFASIDVVNAKCDIERLGCLDGKGNVFILDAPDQHDQTVVTAAHEMLHLAYRRLPQATKDEIGPLLDDAIKSNTVAISGELSSLTTLGDRRDEAHSLLGTEYTLMPPELETYYAKYFSDRTLVVTAAQRSLNQ
jgi:hypothetical protein